MIVVAPVANYVKRGRPMRAAVLLSDHLPPAGSAELLAFSARVDLRPAWIRRKGGIHEHFDLLGRRIELALTRGAVKIDRYRLAEIVSRKRAAIEREVLLAKCGLSAPSPRGERP